MRAAHTSFCGLRLGRLADAFAAEFRAALSILLREKTHTAQCSRNRVLETKTNSAANCVRAEAVRVCGGVELSLDADSTLLIPRQKGEVYRRVSADIESVPRDAKGLFGSSTPPQVLSVSAKTAV